MRLNLSMAAVLLAFCNPEATDEIYIWTHTHFFYRKIYIFSIKKDMYIFLFKNNMWVVFFFLLIVCRFLF